MRLFTKSVSVSPRSSALSGSCKVRHRKPQHRVRRGRLERSDILHAGPFVGAQAGLWPYARRGRPAPAPPRSAPAASSASVVRGRRLRMKAPSSSAIDGEGELAALAASMAGGRRDASRRNRSTEQLGRRISEHARWCSPPRARPWRSGTRRRSRSRGPSRRRPRRRRHAGHKVGAASQDSLDELLVAPRRGRPRRRAAPCRRGRSGTASRRGAGTGDDLLQAGAGVALATEELGGRVDDSFFGVVATWSSSAVLCRVKSIR